MFCKTTLLTVALALVASATPFTRDPALRTGTRIPLRKRGSLTNDDGTFNHEKAMHQIIKLKNKHRQNLVNSAINAAREAVLASVVLVSHATNLAPSQNPTGSSQNGAVSLTDQDQDLEWTGEILIGKQTFVIDFDTGSSDLWVPSSSCEDCKGHTLYDPSQSTDSHEQEGTFTISYGDGSTASGTPYTDTVTVGGVTVTGQYLAAVTQESSQFSQDPADGLMGLAFPSISALAHTPFFFTAMQQGTIPKGSGEFAFKLGRSGSELSLGGANTALYSGDIEFHNISAQSGFWQIGGASALISGTAPVTGFDTVIDSGSTLMTAPPDAAHSFWAAVNGSQEYDQTSGLYSFPCESPPEVAFNWGGRNWTISADDFNLGETDVGSGQCVGALAGADLGLGATTWLLGDAFMKNVYTVFSVDQEAVGFAELQTLE